MRPEINPRKRKLEALTYIVHNKQQVVLRAVGRKGITGN
jgi:hypothetical protein